MTVVNITAKTYTDKAEVLRIQEVPLESIIIEDRFRIDMGNIGELSESIEELGFFDPLLIDEDYRLCDGYRRILGLKEQGHTTALCIIIKRPSPLLAMKLEQQSNNIRKEFTWQEKMDIDKAIDDFNRARDPNWTQEKQGKLRRTSQKSVSLNLELAKAAEKFPELREFKTRKEARKALERVKDTYDTIGRRKRLSDYERNAPKWAADHYRIGDAIEGMKAEPSNSVDFAEVDPPYGVRLDVHKAGTEHIETYHEWTEEEYKERLPIIVDELYRLLRDKTHAVLWFPSNYHDFVLAILKKSSFRLDKVASIWYKGVGNAPAPLYNLALDYEPFFMLRKGNAELAINDGQGNGQGRGHVFWRPADAEKYHSAEKPIDLILDILKTTVGSKPGTRLIVPFLGSGVTLRAAYKLEMNGFGWDSDEGNKIKFLKRVADDEKDDARVADEVA